MEKKERPSCNTQKQFYCQMRSKASRVWTLKLSLGRLVCADQLCASVDCHIQQQVSQQVSQFLRPLQIIVLSADCLSQERRAKDRRRSTGYNVISANFGTTRVVCPRCRGTMMMITCVYAVSNYGCMLQI